MPSHDNLKLIGKEMTFYSVAQSLEIREDADGQGRQAFPLDKFFSH